jgi:hypothetical protein
VFWENREGSLFGIAVPDICCWGGFPHHEGRGRRAGLLWILVPLWLLLLGFLFLHELQKGTTHAVISIQLCFVVKQEEKTGA